MVHVVEPSSANPWGLSALYGLAAAYNAETNRANITLGLGPVTLDSDLKLQFVAGISSIPCMQRSRIQASKQASRGSETLW